MRKTIFNSSLILLAFMIALVAVFGVYMVSLLQVEPIQRAIDDDTPMNIALIIDDAEKPISAQLLMYYPGNARGALLDIPGETGLIIRSINRVDRIDAVYDPADPKPFIAELEGLTGVGIDHYLVLSLQAYSELVDILGGVTIFVPNRIRLEREGRREAVPSGLVVMDGAKIAIYARYRDAERLEAELVQRRQILFQALLRRMGERAEHIAHPDLRRALLERTRSDLKDDSLMRLVAEFARMDLDRIVSQRVTGTYRAVEGVELLFPAWDGQLVKDIVKQTLNALLNAEATAVEDKVFTIEILNGTGQRGLAQRTAEIYASFGYEVVSVGNADSQDLAKTQVLYHLNDEAAASIVAGIIRCANLDRATFVQTGGARADFIIILGRDFNGRYCVD